MSVICRLPSSGFIKAKPCLNMYSETGSSEPGYIKLVLSFPEDDKRRGYKVMVKTEGYPENSSDGIIFYDSNDATHSTESVSVSIKNNAAYVDGITYYFAAFPYTYKNATKVYTEKNAVKCTATPYQTKGEIIFTVSDIFTVPYKVTNIQVFLVGGGAGGGINTGGGGGGYTETYNLSVKPGDTYAVVVGAGGNAGANGGSSKFGTYTASGGIGTNGGSGGGQSTTQYESTYGTQQHGQKGGSNGSNGYEMYVYYSAVDYSYQSRLSTSTTERLGQQTTTRAFGENTGTLYAGGGGGAGLRAYVNGNDESGYAYQGGPGGAGGGGRGADYPPSVSTYTYYASSAGQDNTGGGGGGGNSANAASPGGSGIVIVRWGN